MKRKVFLIISLLCFFSAFAQSKKIQFSVSPYSGLSFGTHYERLYSSFSKENEVSKLEWKMEPLVTIGTDVSLKAFNFFVELGTEYALPVKCGKMLDSDYEPFSSMKYCYSVNELKSKLNLHSHFDIAYIFQLSDFFALKPKMSLLYYYDSYEARNGYGWYGMETKTHPLVSWDDPRAKYYAPGQLNGVDFYRHSILTFIGLNSCISIKNFEMDLGIHLSPYTYFYTMDTHLSRMRDYHLKQIQHASLSQYLFEATARYRINEKLKITCDITHITGNTIKGKLYTDYVSDNIQLSSQKSGASLILTSIKPGVEFFF
jgi:outer membrane protease